MLLLELGWWRPQWEEDNRIDETVVLTINNVDRELDEDIVGLREKYQYGIELSMKKELFNESLNLARKLLGRVKEVLEE